MVPRHRRAGLACSVPQIKADSLGRCPVYVTHHPVTPPVCSVECSGQLKGETGWSWSRVEVCLPPCS